MSNAQVFFAISALVVGLAGLVLRLARTAPDTAVSNLSLWARKAGLHNVRWWSRRVIFLGIVAMAISGACWWSQPTIQNSPPTALADQIPLADQQVHGELKPADDPTPENGCSSLPHASDRVIVLIGDNAFGMSGLGKIIPVRIGTCEAVSMERTADGVFFNAQLVDSEANHVVTISSNKIDALNGEHYSARQSADRASLRINNKQGETLFYARFLNKNTVRISGFFGCAGRPPLLIRDNQPIPGFWMSHNCSLDTRVGIQLN